MKVAIVGGGAAGFYVASRLLTRHASARVHVFDRLWAPHGLVRYGVAPDHPEVKNCTHKFDEVATNPRFRFYGNVNVGEDVSLQHVARTYSHLVFATGCGLPVEHPTLPRSEWCMPALEFVHWYTRHPSAPRVPPALDKMTRVALIGNGNVALDVARMLLSEPGRLAPYDVPQSVLEVLSRSKVSHVDIVARRGPLQSAFTAKELRELLSLPNASMAPLDPSLLAVPADVKPTRPQSRILQLLGQGSRAAHGTTPKSWALHFYRTPTGIEAPPVGGGDLAQLTLAETTLDASGRAVSGVAAAPLPTSLVLPSLGFRATPTTPFFDVTTGHIRTTAGGRVLDISNRPIPRVYAAGWAGQGARGVIAATMMNAYDVAEAVLADEVVETSESSELEMNHKAVDDDSIPLISSRVVTYDDWARINQEEIRRAVEGKERERMDWVEAGAFLNASVS